MKKMEEIQRQQGNGKQMDKAVGVRLQAHQKLCLQLSFQLLGKSLKQTNKQTFQIL